MIIIKGTPDFVIGYIRHAHFELTITDEKKIEEFNKLSTSEKIEKLEEDGHLIIDDYRINDFGEITDIDIIEP